MAEKKTPKRRSTYHHGDLKNALIDATLAMVEEGGPESVSLREVANRVGVAPSAPFRHFRNRTALMTAVSEEAMRRLRVGMVSAVEQEAAADAMTRFKVMGCSYVEWAHKNPTHFKVISNRHLIDFDNSASLRSDSDAILSLMAGILKEAKQDGLLRSPDLSRIPIMARAITYGLARLYIDGHTRQLGLDESQVMGAMHLAIEQFVHSLASRKWLQEHSPADLSEDA